MAFAESADAPSFFPMAAFYDHDWITEVLFPIARGRESTVYCCRAHPRTGRRHLALKVYDELYSGEVAGSVRRSSERVVSGHGWAELETSWRDAERIPETGGEYWLSGWVAHEYDVLHALWLWGASVPRPFAWSFNAVLMEYVGDEFGPAPALDQVEFSRDEAQVAFGACMRTLRLMLRANVVHCDLSADKILLGPHGIALTGFERSRGIRYRPESLTDLRRDVENLCAAFAAVGVTAQPEPIVERLTREQIRQIYAPVRYSRHRPHSRFRQRPLRESRL